jgi:RNA polymerase primary sigma factor
VDSDPQRIARLRDAAVRPASLDASLGEDSSTNVAEVVADEKAETPFQQLRTKFDHELIRKLVQKLPKREEKILRLRFGLDGGEEQTLEEVGEKFGLTRERIRQIQNEAFKKLRVLMENPEALPAAA